MTTPGDRTPLYLEDLSEGLRFTTETHRLTAEEIVEFASRFDPQPFHTDGDAAGDTFFEGLVASGWHTAAITMRLQVESGPPFAGGLIGTGGQIEWPRPTRPGDVLRVESEILEVRSSGSRPGIGVITVRSLTLNQRDEVAQSLTSTMIVPRRQTRE